MGDADNWILDHCSVSWGTDIGGLSIWSSSFPGAEDFTVQICFIGEPLNDNTHAKGAHGDAMNVRNADDGLVYNCLLTHGNARFPQFDGDTASTISFRNLVFYNWKNFAMELENGGNVWVSNVKFIPGLDDMDQQEVTVRNPDEHLFRIFLKHIIGPNRTSDTGTNWVVATDSTYKIDYEPFRGSALRERYVLDDMQSHILYNAGAIIPKRDRVDSTWIQDVRNGTGKIKDAVNLGTIYWPVGDVLSAERVDEEDRIQVSSPPGGDPAIDNVYQNDTLVVDYESDGTWDDSLKINSCDNQGSITLLITDNFETLPDDDSAFRIKNTYADQSRVTGGYPKYNVGTEPDDTDGDLIPDWIENIIGSDPNTADAMGDADSDGYKNVEEWSIYLYSWQPPKLISR